MTLVDTNVIVDILSADPVWLTWSAEQLKRCRRSGLLNINEVTFAELAVRVAAEADLQSALKQIGVELERTPTTALFLAGRAFGRYRAAGGPRLTLLPDFFIGAHAELARRPILTRDVRRFRSYFPNVQLITPDEQDKD